VGSCLRSGRCCTSFGVCITPFDIARIAEQTKLQPERFVMAIDEPPDRARKEPAVLIDGKPSLIVLKWQKRMNCIFYGECGCSAYGCRPLLCRTYPFSLENGNLVEVRSRTCPVPWFPEGTEKDQYVRDIKKYERELRQYRTLALSWNERGGGNIQEFISFVFHNISGKE
jgi:Fe-S-cluster containining protein